MTAGEVPSGVPEPAASTKDRKDRSAVPARGPARDKTVLAHVVTNPGQAEAHEGIPVEPEDVKWLRTLSRKGMTFGSCIRYLRLSTGLSQVEFVESAKKKGIIIDPYTLDEYENNKSTPFLSKLTDVMQAAGLATDTKPAQFLRLYAERHNLQLPTEGQFVMSLDDLQSCTFGTLMRYLRIQRGITSTQLGVDLGYSPTSSFISGVERDEETYPISVVSVESFITWLNLDRDSALAKIIRRKHSKTTGSIRYDTLNRVLEENYLFQKHVDAVKSNQPPTTDLSMFTALQSKPSFQEKIEYLLDHGEIKPDIKERFWHTQKQYSRYLRDTRGRGFTMDEYMLCKLLMVHGYDIHDSITWDMLTSLRVHRGFEEPVRPKSDAEIQSQAIIGIFVELRERTEEFGMLVNESFVSNIVGINPLVIRQLKSGSPIALGDMDLILNILAGYVGTEDSRIKELRRIAQKWRGI